MLFFGRFNRACVQCSMDIALGRKYLLIMVSSGGAREKVRNGMMRVNMQCHMPCCLSDRTVPSYAYVERREFLFKKRSGNDLL